MSDSTVSPPPGQRGWVLLMHQLPAEPAYLRVKVSRRLRHLGALAVRNSVYVLPSGEEAREDFAWLRQEILDSGGEAVIAEATFLEGLTDERLREQFSDERDGEYRMLTAEAQAVLQAEAVSESDLRRLRERLGAIVQRDFFGAPGRFVAVQTLEQVRRRMEGNASTGDAVMAMPEGATWVTRQGVRIDRLASAWLIRRFIDPGSRFKFVVPEGYRPLEGELRFDMYEGEFTHDGDCCTFETLILRFALAEPGLQQLSEVIHDLDLKDEKFGRAEAAGVASLIRGIVSVHADDAARINAAFPVFDALIAGFRESAERA